MIRKTHPVTMFERTTFVNELLENVLALSVFTGDQHSPNQQMSNPAQCSQL